MSHSSLNTSKSSLAIGHRRSSIKMLNHQRSTTAIARKIYLPKIRNFGRLVGGADVAEEPTETKPEEVALPKPVTEISSPPLPTPPLSSPPVPPTPPSSPAEAAEAENKQLLPASGPCCFCTSQATKSVGDKKVDEIIEIAHQNIEDAGKALATLGENFEHDLKLIFVDILGRIQQWSGIVQNKLDACKNQVNNLRNELLARACEVDVKARELADLKAQIADYEDANNKINEKLGLKGDAIRDKRGELTPEAPAAKKQSQRTGESVRGEDGKADTDSVYKFGLKVEASVEDKDGRTDTTFTSVTVQTARAGDEKVKRESELESEVTRLRKENDRIVKERAEYENAIQRALLRGVSSLNVEALKVLRCPPIPCCTPCAPCPASTTVPPQPIVPCPAKSAKRRNLGSAAYKTPYERSARNSDQTYCTRRPCDSPCCSSGRGQSQRLTDKSSVIFLLRQDDAGDLCGPDREEEAPVCGSPIVNKLEIPPLPKFRS